MMNAMRVIPVLFAATWAAATMGCTGDNHDHSGAVSGDAGTREEASVARYDSAVRDDAEAVCGNGIKEPGEACDGLCPTSCEDGDPCTEGVMHGSPETCDAYCIQRGVEPANGDGCCPAQANANTDDDCSPVCGNLIMEDGEACDDGNTVEGDNCSADCTLHALCPDGILEGDYTINSRLDKQDLIGCAQIEGNLHIEALELENLNGLEFLTSIGGDLVLWGNIELRDCSGLDNLATIGGDLSIETNGSITSLNGLQRLETLNGRLYIDNNSMLSDLAALSRLTSLGGSLQIYNSGALGDLQGLDHLTSLGQDLDLRGNEWLVNLDGLNALSSIGASLRIYRNPRLCDLRALSSLGSVEGDFVIHDNESLPTCEAEWLQTSVEIDNIGGDVSIAGNDDRGVCP